jgi:hypothetical protein
MSCAEKLELVEEVNFYVVEKKPLFMQLKDYMFSLVKKSPPPYEEFNHSEEDQEDPDDWVSISKVRPNEAGTGD